MERSPDAAPFARSSRREAEDDQSAERREHPVAVGEAAAANWIEDHIDTAPVGQLLDLLGHVGVSVIDRVVDAKAAQGVVLERRGGADDRRAAQTRQLR